MKNLTILLCTLYGGKAGGSHSFYICEYIETKDYSKEESFTSRQLNIVCFSTSLFLFIDARWRNGKTQWNRTNMVL